MALLTLTLVWCFFSGTSATTVVGGSTVVLVVLVVVVVVLVVGVVFVTVPGVVASTFDLLWILENKNGGGRSTSLLVRVLLSASLRSAAFVNNRFEEATIAATTTSRSARLE